jgi:hypothetical protein
MRESQSAKSTRDNFWKYFNDTWLRSYDVNTWNIHHVLQTEYTEQIMVNRTNNALESYNHVFKEVFKNCGHPTTMRDFVFNLQDQITKMPKSITRQQEIDDRVLNVMHLKFLKFLKTMKTSKKVSRILNLNTFIDILFNFKVISQIRRNDMLAKKMHFIVIEFSALFLILIFF